MAEEETLPQKPLFSAACNDLVFQPLLKVTSSHKHNTYLLPKGRTFSSMLIWRLSSQIGVGELTHQSTLDLLGGGDLKIQETVSTVNADVQYEIINMFMEHGNM